MPTSPIIYSNKRLFTPYPSNNGTPNRLSSLFQSKALLIILVLVIALLSVGGYLLYNQARGNSTSPTTVDATTQPVAPLSGGKIILVSDNTSYKVGEEFLVNIRVDTGGYTTDGTDLVIKYDPTILESTSEKAFEKGPIYQDYPVINIDNQNGMIQVSGIASLNKTPYGFNGIDTFGILKMRAKKAGSGSLDITFAQGSTGDSNIIETSQSKDVLESVQNLKLTFN